MNPHEALRQQLYHDLDRLHGLILRYAHGDSAGKRARPARKRGAGEDGAVEGYWISL